MKTDAEQALDEAVSVLAGMSREHVMVAAAALQGGWMQDSERDALKGLSATLDRLSAAYGTSAEAEGPRSTSTASYRGVAVHATIEDSVEEIDGQVTVKVFIDPPGRGLHRLAYQRSQNAEARHA